MNIVEYMRKGRVRAVIYVRGQNEGIQEVMCRLYAEDKKYDVIKVVKNIDDIYDCDVLLVSHVSKISRNYIKYLQIANALRNRGIEIESALNVGKDKKDKLKNVELIEILKSL